MPKKTLMFGFLILCFGITAGYAEEVKVTTYYPSPYGVYKGLSTTDDTALATGTGKTLLVGATTYSFGTPPKLYVLGSAEADAFRAFEATGVNAFIEAKADPLIKWANIGGYNKSTNGFAPTHLDGSPLALQAKSLSNVGIGTETPSSSAKLDVSSANQGFLPPRVASTASIASPVAGLMIYDQSDNKMKYWDGSQWVVMSGVSTGHVGAPAFDSGWRVYSGSSMLISTFAGAGYPPDQQLVDLEFSPSVQSNFPGINYMESETTSGGSDSTTAWILKTNTSITIRNNNGAGSHQAKVRVRIWVVDN